jgi:hypothetical protein
MLAQAVKPLVRLVDRYLPDPYIFVLILTLIVMAAAMAVEGHGPVAVIGMWGDGFWDLLAFCVIGTGSTTFAFFNLAIIAALLVVVPLINRLMLPSEADSIYVDRALLPDAAPDDGKTMRASWGSWWARASLTRCRKRCSRWLPSGRCHSWPSFPRASSTSSCLRAVGRGQSRARRSCRPPMRWARTWLASQ